MKLGELIDKWHELRAQRKELNSQEREIAKEQEAIEAQLIEQLDTEGMPGGKGSRGGVAISEELFPKVEDWSTVPPELFQRRILLTMFRELANIGELPPGIEPVKIRRLSPTK